MPRFLATLLFVTVLVVPVTAGSGQEASDSYVDVEQAYDLMVKGEAIMVDVRDLNSYVNAHIAGSILVPLNEVSDWAAKSAGETRTIITYCACPNEETSSAAADRLRRDGWDNVLVLVGGIQGWDRAGYPLKAGTRP